MLRPNRAKNIPASADAIETLHRPAAPDGPFKRLGLHGFDPLAPVLVAALATEEPLLLIGPHGTAKSHGTRQAPDGGLLDATTGSPRHTM